MFKRIIVSIPTRAGLGDPTLAQSTGSIHPTKLSYRLDGDRQRLRRDHISSRFKDSSSEQRFAVSLDLTGYRSVLTDCLLL